jgi:hypothetical protein
MSAAMPSGPLVLRGGFHARRHAAATRAPRYADIFTISLIATERCRQFLLPLYRYSLPMTRAISIISPMIFAAAVLRFFEFSFSAVYFDVPPPRQPAAFRAAFFVTLQPGASAMPPRFLSPPLSLSPPAFSHAAAAISSFIFARRCCRQFLPRQLPIFHGFRLLIR